MNRLVYYRINGPEDNYSVIYKMYMLYNMFVVNGEEPYDNDVQEFYAGISEILEIAARNGFSGNLWHCLIACFMVNHENPYSLAAEMTGNPGGSLERTARIDFAILKSIFDINLSDFSAYFPYDYDALANFEASSDSGYMFNKRIRGCITELAKDLEECVDSAAFMERVALFYKSFGVGLLGLHKAFRIDENGNIFAVNNIKHVTLDDLVGYEPQKKRLTDNTEIFLAGKKANNALLYGDAGTGKSTSIKAIANQYYDQGLRLIEVYKHQLHSIHNVIAKIKSRKYKFIIYMDDLSFEEFETEYKYLKAVIEGGLEKKPDNVLIYATSNRRHLIRENFSDKLETDDLHKNDTVQEKLSLSFRFGCQIYFGSPEKKEFNNIVLELKKKNNITMPDDELLLEANKWEMSHGGLSGRCAEQFIDYIAGMQ